MKTTSRIAVSLALGAAILLGAPAAFAGDCPECQSATDCPRAGSFCVRHNNPVGCGSRVQLCCPGQGCAVTSGRPSCEAAGTCTVITGSSDAGVAPPLDAGSPPADAGTRPADVATATDSGGASDAPASVDLGPIDPSMSATGSCGCRVPGARTDARVHLGALGLALAAAGLRRRRRPAA